MPFPEFYASVSFPGDVSRPISRVDLGTRLADMVENGARRNLEALLSGGPAYSRAFLSSAVPPGLREYFQDGRAGFADVAEETRLFVARIGGMEGFAQWHALARAREARKRAVVRASRDLADVAAAMFTTWETSGCDLLAHTDGDRFGTPEELHGDGLAPVWNKPFPDSEPSMEERAAEARRWARESTAPYAWATAPEKWEGVTAGTFAEARDHLLDDDPETKFPEVDDLASAVEDDIRDELEQNHHEDAFDHIEDRPGIRAVAEAWLSALRNGDDAEAKLDAMCAEWNAKQHIVSYLPTRKTAVGLYPDVTKDECVAFARAKVMEASSLLAETDGLWRTPVTDRREVLERLSAGGVVIQPSSPDGWDVLVPASEPMRFPTFELAAECAEQLAGLAGDRCLDPVMTATKEVTSGLMPVIEALEDAGDERHGTAPSHLLRLAREAVSKDGLTVDKISRWLGFIQGVLVVRGHLDMDSERDRTRPIFHAAYAKAGIAAPPTVAVAENRT